MCACAASGLYMKSAGSTSASTAAPLLTAGPSFPPRKQGPISMLLGAPVVFSGAPVVPPAPYGAIQSAGALPAPYSAMQSARVPQITALQPVASMQWPSQPTPYASAFMAPPAWPMYMPCYMPSPPPHSRPLCKLSLKSSPGSAKT